MDPTTRNKAKTLAELLPELGDFLSKNALQNMTLTSTKKPRQTVANTRTSEKVLKPMTFAEMRAEFKASKLKSPRNNIQVTTSVKKKWNSSCKLENKTVSRTANGQMRHDSVRKALNFQQPKTKAPKSFANSRMTVMSSVIPKLPKPEIKAKKSLHLQAHNTVRISGVSSIVETPAIVNKLMKSRMTLSNKENIPYQPNVQKHLIPTPKSTLRKRVMASQIPDTPLSNESWNSSCNDSFLQNEQDIEYIESKATGPVNERTLGNIAEITPSVSTPLMDYRNVQDHFNNSSYVKEDTCQNDTIMCFDNTVSTENGKREESVIVSLCDMLNKATVSNTEKHSTELDDLLQVQKQKKYYIKMIENGVQTLNNIKETELKSLQDLNKLIQKLKTSESDKETSVVPTKESQNDESQLNSSITPRSVLKTIHTSPSYKIPKKCSSIKKKVIFKSMPTISEKALSMYMEMKEQNNYLNTPLKQRPMEAPDTPAITSRNLQMQLDKLYNDNDK